MPHCPLCPLYCPLCVPTPWLWKHVSLHLHGKQHPSSEEKRFLHSKDASALSTINRYHKALENSSLSSCQKELCRGNAAFRTKWNPKGNCPLVLAGMICPVLSLGISLGAWHAQDWDNTSPQVDSTCKADITNVLYTGLNTGFIVDWFFTEDGWNQACSEYSA